MNICALPEAFDVLTATSKASIKTMSGKEDPMIAPLEAISPLNLGSYRVALVSILGDESHEMMRSDLNMAPLLLLSIPLDNLQNQIYPCTWEVQAANSSHIMQFGDVQVDLKRHEIRREDRMVTLTALEFKVLKFFLSHPHQVVTRFELLDTIWGYNRYTVTRTVDNQILRLRKKLEPKPTHPVHFRTVHGVGYKFIP
jgi:DNA-binding response OmpR family regulator